VSIVHNPRGIQGDNFAYTHEFAYFVYPREKVIAGKRREPEDMEWSNLRNWGGESTREDGKRCFYPIVFRDGIFVEAGEVPEDDVHPGEAVRELPDGSTEIWPIDNNGVERKWRYARDTLRSIRDKVRLNVVQGIPQAQILKDEDRPKTVWTEKRYDSNAYGTQLLKEVVGTECDFPFPKSLYNVHDAIRAACATKPNAIVLDFFAGSGTTAHAVLEINKADGGARQCILCTNNENNICTEVTYPRVERVINGYAFEGRSKELLFEKKLNVTALRKSAKILEEIKAIKEQNTGKYDEYEVKVEDNNVRLIGKKNVTGEKEGFGGSLKYYRTGFIGKNNVANATDADKVELAHQAGGLLALAENTLYKVEENEWWQVYENEDRYTAVYFREELDEFEAFVKQVEGLEYAVTVYVFSWGDDEFADEFAHIEEVTVKTIPLPILEIYRNIYNLG